MKRNVLVMVTLALLLVALIAGCRRAKPAVVSEVQATPTTAAAAATGRTVVPVASPTSTSEVTPEATLTPGPEAATSTPGPEAVTSTPSPEAATPTPHAEATRTPIAPTSTPIPTKAPTKAPTVAPAATPTPAVSGERTHVVQPGENLFRIALHYGMAYQAVAAANGIINPDLIYVGQSLTIPAEGTAEPTGERTHVVQPGENLFRIALKYGVTVQAIAVANDISNANLIYPGQTLVIP